MIKYIATDLDGTLFYPKDRKHLVRIDNLRFIREFIKQGGKIIIISGRSVEFSRKVVKLIGYDCDIIGFNGAVVQSANQIVQKHEISNLDVITLVTETNKYKFMSTVLFTAEGLYARFRKWWLNSGFTNFIYKLFLGKYSEFLRIKKKEYIRAMNNESVYKVLFFVGVTKKKIKEACTMSIRLKKQFPNLEIHWSKQTIEISPKNCTKGIALANYCEANNIDKNEVLVIGDSGNDVPMFKEFYNNSYCMSKAPVLIKKEAKYSIDKISQLSSIILKK